MFVQSVCLSTFSLSGSIPAYLVVSASFAYNIAYMFIILAVHLQLVPLLCVCQNLALATLPRRLCLQYLLVFFIALLASDQVMFSPVPVLISLSVTRVRGSTPASVWTSTTSLTVYTTVRTNQTSVSKLPEPELTNRKFQTGTGSTNSEFCLFFPLQHVSMWFLLVSRVFSISWIPDYFSFYWYLVSSFIWPFYHNILSLFPWAPYLVFKDVIRSFT